ncbi:MAG: hypothetical protein ACK5JT_00465 [Hyphomicrobiaceae bacterium]
MLPRNLFILCVALTLSGGLWLHGQHIGRSQCEARHSIALAKAHQETARVAAQANMEERARLAVEAEYNKLAKELEDAAREDPVTAPGCLPAGRVRRLNNL